ncbi:MAG TPA: DUF4389 domain-containing protein [Thermoleophilaceae bacterium]|nr:DUF4389 domain-containing protein [Thermoleophilaceae bacterium]
MESGTPGPPPAPEAPVPSPVGPIGGTDGTPQVRAGDGPPSAPYVAVTEFDRQDEYSRFLPIVKGLLLIPHWFMLIFVGIAALFVIVWAFFAVLFTGKFPEAAHSFITGTYRWATRVYAYMLLMTDRYPPFSLDDDDEYPARLDIAYTEEIARWRPLVHWLLVIPYLFVAGALLMVLYVTTIIAFFAILFTKKFPEALFDFNVVALRWQTRGNAYAYWMTERYPPWVWS